MRSALKWTAIVLAALLLAAAGAGVWYFNTKLPVRKGALVEHMLYPMQTHGFSGASRQHLYRLLARFFAEHLLRPTAAPRR